MFWVFGGRWKFTHMNFFLLLFLVKMLFLSLFLSCLTFFAAHRCWKFKKKKCIIRNIILVCFIFFFAEFDENLLPMSVDEMTIPEMSRHVCNLVPYVSRSETLQNLVKLGVNLDVVQRVRVFSNNLQDKWHGRKGFLLVFDNLIKGSGFNNSMLT